MLNVEGSRLARQQRQPASSPTDRPCREDTLLCHEQGGIDQISRVRLFGIACTEISGSSTNRFARRIEQPDLSHGDLSHGDLTAKADCDVRPGPPGTALII